MAGNLNTKQKAEERRREFATCRRIRIAVTEGKKLSVSFIDNGL
jgi:hypothetical protein